MSYKELCRDVLDLDHEVHLRIRDILVEHAPDFIKESTDGIRVVVEQLPPHVIKMLQSFINNHLQLK